MRKLNAKEAEAVLLQMGLDVTTLKKLKRWDRIHLIREMANKAAEAGISEGLHKYVLHFWNILIISAKICARVESYPTNAT